MSEVLDWLNLVEVSAGSNEGTDVTQIKVDTTYPDNYLVRAGCDFKRHQVIAVDYSVTGVIPVDMPGIEALAQKYGSSANQAMVKLWASKILLNGNKQLDSFLENLYPRVPEVSLSSIYFKLFSNMFQMLGEGYHIFSTFTFINHSCNANSVIIIGDDGNYKLIALRDIAAGEEITQDYIGLDINNRGKEMVGAYGFECTCGFCDNPQIGCKFLLQNRSCWSCRKPGPKHRCSKCRVALYCGGACQRKNWSKHKLNCDLVGKIFTYDPKDPLILSGVDIERIRSLFS